MRKEEFENAFQFLAGYFHQDFGVEFGEPEIAVGKFIEDSEVTVRAAVVSELRRVIQESSERELEDAVFELGCYYSPQRHRGITMAVWLQQVLAQIEKSLAARDSKTPQK
jgi:hypothetical protein